MSVTYFRNGMGLTDNEISEVIKLSNSAIDNAEHTMSKLKKRINRSRLALDSRRIELENALKKGENTPRPTVEFDADELFTAMKNSTLDLYKICGTAPVFDGLFLEEAAAASRTNPDCSAPKPGVKAVLHDGTIYVRTPMLWTVNGRRIKGNGGRYLGAERYTFFRDEVAQAIKNALNFPGFDLGSFKTKTFHYLYVYNSLSSSPALMPDNDNHETKFVQDAIAMFLPGGDTPLSCSIFSSATLSSRVPEGTYITVSPGLRAITSDSEVLNFWANLG